MLPNQMFNAVLSSLRTFDPLSDTLDILIISFVFYQLLQFARKSRAGQLVKGIILILVFYGLAVMLNLKTVTWVLNNVITIGFMAAVVIFQPELRRTLERMGQSTMWANLLVGNRRSDPSLRGAWQSAVVAICDAAEQLSDTRTGALMVLERNNNLDEIIRTGTPMHADVIPEMLGTIFYEGTPLPWLAPQLSKVVYVVSDLAIAIGAYAGFQWLSGHNTLTNVEALAGMMFLGWFIIFSRQIAAIEADRVQTQLILAQSERPRSVEDLAEVSETVPDTVSRLAAQV